MGLFWDKLKAMFRKKGYVEFAEETPNFSIGRGKIVLTVDPQLSYRKNKSQRRNWKRWKRRI